MYRKRPEPFAYARIRARAKAQRDREGQHYDAQFLTAADREQVMAWLSRIHPLWEQRYSAHHPPPPGKEHRGLLRPVYWLGNWQFACLGYYHPPKGVKNRCVRAEPFPEVLAKLVAQMEQRARKMFRGPDLPAKWHLNTCLVNLYGSRLDNGKWVDTARVGEHKDFEPGPVASLSLGERALFQFVSSSRQDDRDAVVTQQWLDDGSLQIFGGERFKKHLFHRVQRVDHKAGERFVLQVENFETRRINFTFRYVPDEDVIPYRDLPKGSREDVRGYMETLARHSEFFAAELG